MRSIDVRHLGTEKVICCWEVDGLLIDPGPESSLRTLLTALDGQRPRGVLLTHIHLDHAGSVGALVRRWPDLPVWVHERGATHLVDPSRLLRSVARLWDDADERWGEVLPVPEANLRPLSDGDDVEGFRVGYTPGHASHHVCLLHEASGQAFVGDVLGIRISPAELTVMPTPAPDIDVEAWQHSISVVEGWRPGAVALTHFGRHEDVGALIAAARRELEALADDARRLGEREFVERFEADVAARTGDATMRETYRQAAPPDLQYGGLARYWDKR